MWSYVDHDPHLSVLTLGLKRGVVLNRNIDNGLLQHVVFLKTFILFSITAYDTNSSLLMVLNKDCLFCFLRNIAFFGGGGGV